MIVFVGLLSSMLLVCCLSQPRLLAVLNCRNDATAAARSVFVCPVLMLALLPDCCPSSPQLRFTISRNALNMITVAQIIIEFTQ